MNTPRTLLLAAAVAFFSAACATTGDVEARGNPDLLTAQEIEASGARNALELIEHLRPRWLQQRFDRSVRLGTTVLVYQNHTRLGGREVLRDIPVQGIHSIRYLGSSEAGRLPGAGSGSVHVDGAIVITTASQRAP
jgi:hypothetical protein